MTRQLSQDLIYEAILDDGAFASLPGLLAEASGARSALMQWRTRSGETQILAHNGYFTDQHMAAYVAGFADHDLWLKVGLDRDRRNEVIGLDDLVGEEVFANSIMYNEFIRAMGDDTFRCMGAILDTPFGMGALGIHRGRGQKPFELRRVAEMNQFAASLRRMMAIRGELITRRADQDATRSSFDSLDLAILQVDSEGRLLDGNALATELLRDACGLSVRKGHVHAQGQRGPELKKAIARATDRAAPEASLLTVSAEGGVTLGLTVSPLRVPGARARALILIKPPFGRQTDLDKSLMRRFGLSRAEAQVSISLAEGLSPSDIAVRRQVAEGTVRIQLKTIMAKLGCRRQAQIAAAVLSLPPLRLS